MQTSNLPVGRARLSAATSRIIRIRLFRKPTSFPDRLKPQTVRIEPETFCGAREALSVRPKSTRGRIQMWEEEETYDDGV